VYPFLDEALIGALNVDTPNANPRRAGADGRHVVSGSPWRLS